MFALANVAGRAHALAAELKVEPGATCVSAPSLRTQIVAWLGDRELGAGMTVAVRGSLLDPREVGFELMEGARSIASRRFAPGPSACAQLEASLALAIALATIATLASELNVGPRLRF